MSTKRRHHSHQCLSKPQQFQKEVFEKKLIVVEPTIAAEAKLYLDILNDEIMEAEYKTQHILTIVMEGDIKVEHDNEWRKYHEKNS